MVILWSKFHLILLRIGVIMDEKVNSSYFERSWNILDKIIAKFRYVQVDKHIIKGSNIVDVGCGQEGAFLIRHKANIDHGWGFDFEIEDHEYDNITFINNRELDKFPLKDNSIDTVFMNALLEHLENPEILLMEVFRILKKNGKLVMTTPTPLSKPLLEFMAYKLHIINEVEIREHKHYYSKQDITDLISSLNNKYSVKLSEYKTFEIKLNSLIVIEKLK